jgi:predicted dehydrogenase
MDAAQSGGGAIGDIGTHAYNLMCFVTGQRATSLSATLTAFVAGRSIDDDARISLRLDGGGSGQIWASQVAVGHENDLTLTVYGSKGALRWSQEHPNSLRVTTHGGATQIITRGGAMASPAAAAVTRIPAGHPEGYLEAFATIYREASDAILNTSSTATGDTLIGVEQGLDGVRFVDACQRSSADSAAWIDL